MKLRKLFGSTSEQLESKETAELWRIFVEESKDNLETCQSAITSLSGDQTRESFDDMFRALHTMKSGSAYLGAHVIELFTHELETLLESLRDQNRLSSAEAFKDLLAESFDNLHACLEDQGYCMQENLPAREADLVQRLHKLSETTLPAEPPTLQPSPEATPESLSQDLVIRTIKQQVALIVHILKKGQANELSEEDFEALRRAYHTLSNSAIYLGDARLENIVQNAETLFDQNSVNSMSQDVLTSQMMTFILKLKSSVTDIFEPKEEISEVETPALPEADELEVKSSETSKKSVADAGIRVDQQHIGTIMNMVGELITTRNAMHHLIPQLEKESASRDATIKELKSISKRLDQIADSMRVTVMSMRLVPIRYLYQRLGRLVRDLARRTNKKVELELEGEETEVDKAILDKLSEPLTHILRNAIDHGIEAASEREKLGKSTSGTIRIRTRNIGSSIQIRVEDDGRGISEDFVKSQALRKGYITTEAAANLSSDEALQLIFIPGFSTTEKLSHISGRGIGMDAVKTVVDEIRGQISLETKVHAGTSIAIDVPVQASVIPALLVEVQGRIYAISLEIVAETVKIRRSALTDVNGSFTLVLRDKMVEILDLHAVFEGAETLRNCAPDAVLNIVVLNEEEQQYGLAVDRICRREEILVKPLPDTVNPYQMFTGASILGDGQAVLIFDPDISACRAALHNTMAS